MKRYFNRVARQDRDGKGLPREDAYAMVQRAAARTWDEGLHFREEMWSEVEPTGVMTKDDLWGLFVLGPFVEHLDDVFARLEKLEVEGS